MHRVRPICIAIIFYFPRISLAREKSAPSLGGTFDESNLARAATTNPSADKMDLRRPAVLREVDQIAVGVRDTVLRLSIRRPLLDLRRRSQFFAKWF
jgi:hypothetical protein